MAAVLPYPDMDFVPLDILTASELNQMVANIEYLETYCSGLASGSNIANDAITTAKILDGAVTSSKIDWSTIDLGWEYLGQTKLTSASNTVAFVLPAQYNGYKILFGGEMASSTASGAWLDVRFDSGTTGIANSHQIIEITGTSAPNVSQQDNASYIMNAGSAGTNAYDGLNIELYSLKTSSAQWRKFQGKYCRVGNGITTLWTNGRLSNSTEPTRFSVVTGGSFAVGSTLRVWGCNI